MSIDIEPDKWLFDLVVPDTQGRTVIYRPWTDGYAVGFQVNRDDGKVEYIYLNPSNNDDGSDDPQRVHLHRRAWRSLARHSIHPLRAGLRRR